MFISSDSNLYGIFILYYNSIFYQSELFQLSLSGKLFHKNLERLHGIIDFTDYGCSSVRLRDRYPYSAIYLSFTFTTHVLNKRACSYYSPLRTVLQEPLDREHFCSLNIETEFNLLSNKSQQFYSSLPLLKNS